MTGTEKLELQTRATTNGLSGFLFNYLSLGTMKKRTKLSKSIHSFLQEKLNIWKALEQAKSDRPMGKTPVVVFTKNFENDYACLEFEDFMNLLLTIQQLQDEINTKKDS